MQDIEKDALATWQKLGELRVLGYKTAEHKRALNCLMTKWRRFPKDLRLSIARNQSLKIASNLNYTQMKSEKLNARRT